MPVATERQVVPIVTCAPLLLLERGALLFGATIATQGDSRGAVLLAAIVGAAYIARSAATSLLVRREEAGLYDDLLEATLVERGLEVDDASLQYALFDGVDAEAAARARLRPALVGDGIAALGLCVFFAVTLQRDALLSFTAATLTAGIVALVIRRSATALAVGGRDRHEAAVRVVLDGLLGRADLVAAGASPTHRARASVAIAAWSKAQRRVAVATALLGRAPIAIAVGVGIAVALALRPGSSLAELAVPAVALPAFAGVLQASSELVRSRPIRTKLAALLAGHRQGDAAAPDSIVPFVLTGVDVHYGETRALGDVSLDLPEKGLVCVAGANGSGKSTLLRVLGRLVQPTKGVVSAGSTDLRAVDGAALRRRYSILSQRPYFPRGSVRDAVRFLDPDVDDAEALDSLARVHVLEALKTHSPAEPLSVSVDSLSGGERQRVALARSLLRDAEVHLFDEPDANLDRRGIEMVVGILRELSKTSLVVVAGHTEEVIAAADVVVRLDQGRVVKAR